MLFHKDSARSTRPQREKFRHWVTPCEALANTFSRQLSRCWSACEREHAQHVPLGRCSAVSTVTCWACARACAGQHQTVPHTTPSPMPPRTPVWRMIRCETGRVSERKSGYVGRRSSVPVDRVGAGVIPGIDHASGKYGPNSRSCYMLSREN